MGFIVFSTTPRLSLWFKTNGKIWLHHSTLRFWKTDPTRLKGGAWPPDAVVQEVRRQDRTSPRPCRRRATLERMQTAAALHNLLRCHNTRRVLAPELESAGGGLRIRIITDSSRSDLADGARAIGASCTDQLRPVYGISITTTLNCTFFTANDNK